MSFDEEHLDDHRECRREIEEVQAWANHCYACAIEGELPLTRKEFEQEGTNP